MYREMRFYDEKEEKKKTKKKRTDDDGYGELIARAMQTNKTTTSKIHNQRTAIMLLLPLKEAR